MVNICLSTNKAYVTLTKMCIYDIITRKNKDTKITFYVLCDNLYELADTFHIFDIVEGIRVVTIQLDSDEIFSRIDTSRLYATRPGLPRTMYLRFLAPILPELKSVERLLYIDPDMLNRRDVSNLFHTDIHGHPLAMTRDSFYIRNEDPEATILEHKNGYNAGLIIMDLFELRKLNFTGFCMRTIETCPYNDQQVINELYRDIVYPLPPTVQFPIHNLIQHIQYMEDVDRWNKFHHTSYKSMDEIMQNAVFYHFHEDKSWQMSIRILKLLWDFSEARVREFEQSHKLEPITEECDAMIEEKLKEAMI